MGNVLSLFRFKFESEGESLRDQSKSMTVMRVDVVRVRVPCEPGVSKN